MNSRIIVIFESDRPSPEAIQYSSALARRMDGEIILLRLGEPPLIIGEETLQIAEGLSSAGIRTGCEARAGDPRSELLKFMATGPSCLAVVWGGREDVVLQRGKPHSHWLAPLQEGLDCPLITMHRKAEG